MFAAVFDCLIVEVLSVFASFIAAAAAAMWKTKRGRQGTGGYGYSKMGPQRCLLPS